MKRILVLMMCVMLVMAAAGCSKKEEAPAPVSSGTEKSSEIVSSETEESSVPSKDYYAFDFEGTELIPGEAFDSKAFREANSVYVVPSCAIDGEDNVYNYDAFEITAFSEKGSEYIYSIYFIDPNLTTPEGLALGDDRDRAVSLYGEPSEEQDSEIIYRKGQTLLILILDGDIINSIEYRLDI